jgi:hypothetical protein
MVRVSCRWIQPFHDRVCPEPGAGEVRAWIHSVARRIIDLVDKQRLRSCILHRSRGEPKFVAIALSMMTAMKLAALPNDKTGGFSLMRKESLPTLFETALDMKVAGIHVYRRIAPHMCKISLIREQINGFAYRIEKLEEQKGLAASILRPARVPSSRIKSALMLNVKSHKPDGKVGVRNIHASSGSAFRGIGRWVAMQLQQTLQTLTHLLPNSTEFIKQIVLFTPSDSHVWVKLDIKDFFLSGSSDQIVHDITTPFDYGPRRELIGDATRFLCENQYIGNPFDAESLWQVEVGTGMGLNHSGEVSDFAFWSASERLMLPLLHTFDIDGWWRFKDDMLILGRDITKIRQFLNVQIKPMSLSVS